LLRSTLGAAAEGGIADFYARHDGATLYANRRSKTAGIRLFPISMWDKATRRFNKDRTSQAEDLDDWGRRQRALPNLDGVVIGEIPRSGNYLIVRLSGKHRGGIFYANHDDSGSACKPLARNFAALLDRIAADPAKFLCDMGGYTRFSDGKTDTQWIPNEFIGGVVRNMYIG
jgi:hypothetical protein